VVVKQHLSGRNSDDDCIYSWYKYFFLQQEWKPISPKARLVLKQGSSASRGFHPAEPSAALFCMSKTYMYQQRVCIPEVIKSKTISYQRGPVRMFPSRLQAEGQTVFAYRVGFPLGNARWIAYRNAV